MDALDRDEALPYPFDDAVLVRSRLRTYPDYPNTVITGLRGGEPTVQQSMAVSALFGAVDEDPMRAAVKALADAVVTYGADYPALFAEVRRFLPLARGNDG